MVEKLDACLSSFVRNDATSEMIQANYPMTKLAKRKGKWARYGINKYEDEEQEAIKARSGGYVSRFFSTRKIEYFS